MKHFPLLNILVLIAIHHSAFAEDWNVVRTDWSTGPYTAPAQAIYFLNADTGFACGFSSMLLRTSNGGTTWDTIHVTDSVRFFRCIAFGSPLQGSLGGEYFTSDGGLTWQASPLHSSFSGATQIMFVNDSIAFACTGGSDRGYDYAGKSTDGGKTWVSIFNDAYECKVTSIDFSDPMHGMITSVDCGEPLTYRLRWTSDGGITWSPELGGIGGGELYSVTHASATTWVMNEGELVYGPLGNLWSSSIVSGGNHLRNAHIAFFDSTCGYAASDVEPQGILFKTTDQGHTWDKRNVSANTIPAPVIIAISAPTKDVVYLLDQEYVTNSYVTHILKSTTGGGPATRVNESIQPTAPAISISPNPVSATDAVVHFAISSTRRNLVIADCLGRVVRSVVIEPGASSLRIDLSAVVAGMYVCKMGASAQVIAVVR